MTQGVANFHALAWHSTQVMQYVLRVLHLRLFILCSHSHKVLLSSVFCL